MAIRLLLSIVLSFFRNDAKGRIHVIELYRKEEIEHINNIPARILHQQLSGTECTVSMHWHKHIELNLILKGEAEFTVDGIKSLLKPGDFIIINSSDIHMGTTPLQIPLQDRYQELITILWDYDFLHRYVDHLSGYYIGASSDWEYSS